MRAGFTSIIEAIGFPNRRHQQSVVSERVQQESDVLKKAYTRSREQQKNRLMQIVHALFTLHGPEIGDGSLRYVICLARF